METYKAHGTSTAANAHVKEPIDFNAITLRLASPERIKEWSYGEVTKPETVNYRTQRSERKGLFDEAIFGPEKDYECYCGKYRRIRYKDIICEKCGVEVTRSIVRRERMGHIELASPVAHVWFLKGIPSRMGVLLGVPVADLEKVVYFSGYIVTKVNEAEKDKVYKELDTEYKAKYKTLRSDEARERLKQSLSDAKGELDMLKRWKVLDEVSYHKYSMKYGHVFEAEIGAEAVYNIFRSLDLDKMYESSKAEYEQGNASEKPRIERRLNLLKSLRRGSVRPEWMFLKVIPVIPPALRPMVALDGGRHATSDINDLYRRVINRNNRLKKLLELSAPDVILRNEKRILQEAVDALIDNSIHKATGAVSQAQRRPLKSLSDNLKGKHGRFRQNLLGKRVDYSGRSVIVVGPELKLSQCGLPKHMALELFRPFVISKLLERELAFNIRGAGKLIDEGIPEVWEILEDVIRDKRVLLNRAPTLHRLGVQAFKPVLIEGNAIQVHPLVCSAFNADFDGDQMAVHLPLSNAAQKEADEIMASEKNLLGPGNNEVLAKFKLLDIILGCYWMTKTIGHDVDVKSLKYFSSPNAAIASYDYRQINLREEIMVLPTEKEKFGAFENKPFRTSVGRLRFNSFLPDDFPYINKPVTAKDMSEIVDDLIARYGLSELPAILDNVKKSGFLYAKKSGISWGIDAVRVPDEKKGIIAEAKKKVATIEDKFSEGFISDEEKYRMSIEVWQEAKNKLDKILPTTLEADGSVVSMLTSGARGKIINVSQMAGMKGLIVNPSGRTINFPVIPSYMEGLSPLEYFITTHGARKGLTDTALNTAKAGYLTRKLVYVADSLIISEEDCGDTVGRVIKRAASGHVHSNFAADIRGRVLLSDVKGVLKKGELIFKREAALIDATGTSEVIVRSPLSCKTLEGLCRKCYGLDMGRNALVELGEAVGVVAAQAIGEPGTQLTMRTFHQGGVATDQGDITTGLPRVEEIFEKRLPKNPSVISGVDGEVVDIRTGDEEQVISILTDPASRGKSKDEREEYTAPRNRTILVKKGALVKKGDILTDGPVDISLLFEMSGRIEAENHILEVIHEIYSSQGAVISRKHIEVIVRQMFSRKRIKDAGDTVFAKGEIVSAGELIEENEFTVSKGGKKAQSEDTLLGISDVSMTTSSFLAAASFENTQRTLTSVALRGGVDRLDGLKENVLIGRLIPAGTGWKNASPKSKEKSRE
ncbi:MAG TPA: DNA-directed RNA polymerase subunit beta' [Candidatus Paceibacterota bacterium]